MEAKIKNISVVGLKGGSLTPQWRPKPKAVKSARVIFIAAALFSIQASLSSIQGEWPILIVNIKYVYVETGEIKSRSSKARASR